MKQFSCQTVHLSRTHTHVCLLVQTVCSEHQTACSPSNARTFSLLVTFSRGMSEGLGLGMRLRLGLVGMLGFGIGERIKYMSPRKYRNRKMCCVYVAAYEDSTV